MSQALARYNKKPTVTSREIQTSVRLILPGELAKHAVSEARACVDAAACHEMQSPALICALPWVTHELCCVSDFPPNQPVLAIGALTPQAPTMWQHSSADSNTCRLQGTKAVTKFTST